MKSSHSAKRAGLPRSPIPVMVGADRAANPAEIRHLVELDQSNSIVATVLQWPVF